jgi:hypothetical protein
LTTNQNNKSRNSNRLNQGVLEVLNRGVLRRHIAGGELNWTILTPTARSKVGRAGRK